MSVSTDFPLTKFNTDVTDISVGESPSEKEIHFLESKDDQLLLQDDIIEPGETVLDAETSILLCEYIFSKFGDERVAEKISCLSKVPSHLASYVAIGSGYVSWYPIIVGVMDLGFESKLVKVILAGGSWASYGSLYAWGTLEIVQELFKKRTAIQLELLKSSTHPCLSILYKAAIVILGLGATVPNAYFAYVFNKKNVFWTIVNISGSWGISAYPIHNMRVELQENLQRCGLYASCVQKERWNRVRGFFILKLDALLQDVSKIDMNLSETDMGTLSSQGVRSSEFAKFFFSRIFFKYQKAARDLEEVQSIIEQKKVQYPVKLLSATLPISNIFANAKAAWNFVGLFTNSIAAKLFVMPIALAPSYLTYSLNRDCMLFIIRQIVSKILGKDSRSLSSIHFPKARVVLIAGAVVISLLSASIDYATAREIYSEDTPLDWTATVTSVVNSLALTLLPMIDLSTKILNEYMYFFGSHEFKQSLNFIQSVNELKFFISRSSDNEFRRFVEAMKGDSRIADELSRRFPWIVNS